MRSVEAIVRINKDPERRGRVRVECEALQEGGSLIGPWVDPAFPVAGPTRGFFFVPKVGEAVMMHYDVPEQHGIGSSLLAPRYTWTAQVYAGKIGLDVLTKNYGSRIALTDGAAALVLDEKATAAYLLSSHVGLGTEDAANPLVLGDILQPILSSLITAIQTQHNAHIHQTNVGPSAPPTVPMDLSSSQSSIDGDTWLSDTIFGVK